MASIVGRNLLSIWGVFGSGISVLELGGILYVSVWFQSKMIKCASFQELFLDMRDVFLMLVNCFREVL